MDAKQWAEKAAKQIKEKNERITLDTRKRLHDAELKASHAPGLWNAVKDSLKQRVDALNNEMSEEIIFLDNSAPDAITAKTRSWSQVTLKFNSQKHELRCDWPNTTTDYGIHVLNSDEVTFWDKNGMPITTDKIAEDVLLEVIKSLS